jgi:hypothetical protein
LGRGNVCVNEEYEGLYYVDFDHFECFYEDEDGSQRKDKYGYPVHDYELERDYLEDAIEEFVICFTRRFKSFHRCDTWLGNECHAILENALFYIAVEDNQWSEAFMLLQKEQSYYSEGCIEGLQSRHYIGYLHGMRDCLFEQFNELGIYTGAWTSGTITRPSVKAAA